MFRRTVIVICIALAAPGLALEITETGPLPEKGVFVGDVGEMSLRVLGSQGLVGNVGARKSQFIRYLNMSEGFAREAATSGTEAELHGTIYQSTIEKHEDVPPWETTVTAHEPGRRAAFEASGRLHSPFREVGEFERVEAGRWRGEVTWTREPAENARMRLAVYLFAWLQDRPLTIVRPDGTVVDELDGERLRVWATGEHGVFEAGTRIVFPLKVGETAVFTIHEEATLTSFNFGVHFGGFWVTPTDGDAEQMRITIERISDPLQVVSGDLTATVEAHSGEAAIHHGPFKLIEHVELVDGDARQWDVLPMDGWQALTEGEAVAASGDLGGTWRERVEPGESQLGGGAIRLSVERDEAGGEARLRLVLPPVHVGQPIEWHGRGPHGEEPLFRTGDEGVSAPLPVGAEVRIPLARGLAMALTPSAECRVVLGREGTERAMLSFVMPEHTREFALTVDCGLRPDDWEVESYTERDFVRIRSASTGVKSGLQVRRDTPQPRDVQIVSPWWTVTHSAQQGGAISQIDFCYGRPGGVLTSPIGTGIMRGPSQSWGNTGCPDATLTVAEQTPERVTVVASGELCDIDGTPIPLGYEITCEYHPTHVKRTVRLTPERPIPDVRLLGVAGVQARDSLHEFVGGRTYPVWGKSICGEAYSRRGYPEYIALFERDVECLEMFPAQDLTQWAQVRGDPEDCSWRVDGSTIMLNAYERLEGPITLSEPMEFTHYIGLPPIPRANREKHAWHMLTPNATEEEIAGLAYTGVDSIHGNVGDPLYTGSDGDWERTRTGGRELTERCHRYGLPVVPYLFFLPMREQNPVYAEHQDDWRVTPAKKNVACTVSEGWRHYYRQGLTRLLDEGGYDGVYYDFVSVYQCENEAHGEVPHSTVEGLMETLQFTREAIGEDGLLIGHRGHQANTVIDSYLDGVVVFEHYSHPHWLPLDELEPLNTFVGASRRDTCTKSLVCSLGGLNPRYRREEGPRVIDADEILCKLALQGLFPYSFRGWSEEVLGRYFRLYARFRSVDFSRLTFMDHLHQPAIRSDDPYLRAAAYFGESEAYLVVANPESDQPRETSFRVDAREFGWDADECAISEQPDGAGARRISADELRAGIECTLGVYGYRVYALRALDGERPRVVSSTHRWEEREVDGAAAIVTRGPVGQECTLIVACPERPDTVTLDGEALAADAWSWDAEGGMAMIGYTCRATGEPHVFVVQ